MLDYLNRVRKHPQCLRVGIFIMTNLLTGIISLVNAICLFSFVWNMHRSSVLLICFLVSVVLFVLYVVFQIVWYFNPVFFDKYFFAYIMFQFIIQEMVYILALVYVPLFAHLKEFFDYVRDLEANVAAAYWIVFALAIIFFIIELVYYTTFAIIHSSFFEEFLKKKHETQKQEPEEPRDPEPQQSEKDNELLRNFPQPPKIIQQPVVPPSDTPNNTPYIPIQFKDEFAPTSYGTPESGSIYPTIK